jgi:hypothetical protein
MSWYPLVLVTYRKAKNQCIVTLRASSLLALRVRHSSQSSRLTRALSHPRDGRFTRRTGRRRPS